MSTLIKFALVLVAVSVNCADEISPIVPGDTTIPSAGAIQVPGPVVISSGPTIAGGPTVRNQRARWFNRNRPSGNIETGTGTTDGRYRQTGGRFSQPNNRRDSFGEPNNGRGSFGEPNNGRGSFGEPNNGRGSFGESNIRRISVRSPGPVAQIFGPVFFPDSTSPVIPIKWPVTVVPA